jgi:hypothetical protein
MLLYESNNIMKKFFSRNIGDFYKLRDQNTGRLFYKKLGKEKGQRKKSLKKEKSLGTIF